MIEINNFTFYYGDASQPSLRDINLYIQDGEYVLVNGPSGSGKSSLCRCLNGLIPHFYGGKISGNVTIQGLDVMSHSTKEMSTKVGIVFQNPENQLITIDVEREIAFGLENLALPRELIAKRIEESLDTVGISELRYRQIQTLSGGEKQKVAIAAILALHPAILVMDEPTSQLDPRSAEEVLNLVERLNNELGITVILIEHRLERVLHYADRLIVMHEGRIAADGHPREILGNQDPSGVFISRPPIIELAQKIRSKGMDINEIPLTVKEARSALNGIFQGCVKPTIRSNGTNSGREIIQVNKLWFAYNDNHAVLKNINLVIREGEFIAIMGKNGSGKTTLVKHFNGLLKPIKGKVAIDGTDTRKATVAELARKIGFVLQNPNDHLFADTTEEEIAFTLKNLGFKSNIAKERIEYVLDKFNLERYRTTYPRSLSGGEGQRVALASVIVAEPKVLILDEPTRGMEHGSKMQLMDFLDRYRKNGNAVILVTHDVEIVAEYADRVILLSEGEILADDEKRHVLSGGLFFSPQINRLMQAFGKYGVPDDILTVSEAIGLLE